MNSGEERISSFPTYQLTNILTMVAINYAAAIFLITSVTYVLMCMLMGKGIIASLPYALILGFVMGFITLFASIFLLHKKHIKVYELKDDDHR